MTPWYFFFPLLLFTSSVHLSIHVIFILTNTSQGPWVISMHFNPIIPYFQFLKTFSIFCWLLIMLQKLMSYIYVIWMLTSGVLTKSVSVFQLIYFTYFKMYVVLLSLHVVVGCSGWSAGGQPHKDTANEIRNLPAIASERQPKIFFVLYYRKHWYIICLQVTTFHPCGTGNTSSHWASTEKNSWRMSFLAHSSKKLSHSAFCRTL